MLSEQVGQAAIIEESNPNDTEVSVGTEAHVEMLDGSSSRSYWVLGYDDTRHGDNVVSFQSEVGRALWRKTVGETFDLPGEHGTAPARVTKIRVRMPETAVGENA